MAVKPKAWFAACLLAFVFAVACNGQAGDAISSIASNRPSGPGVSFSPSISVPSGESPSEAPTEAPSEAPTETATEAPAPSEAASPSASGSASSGTSTAIWWGLALLAATVLVVVLGMRRRRGPSATMQQAYAASAAVRDRLAQEVSSPSAVPGALETLVDEADLALRAVETSAPDQAARTAVDNTLRAINDVRGALSLRAATAGAAHASGADVEARLLRALAALDAALGPLRQAAGGAPPPTTGGAPPSTTGFEV